MDTISPADGLCILGFSSSSPVLTGIGLYILGLPRGLLTRGDADAAGGSTDHLAGGSRFSIIIGLGGPPCVSR